MIEKNVLEVQNDPSYQMFLLENPNIGFLKIRASSLNSAIPVSGIRVKVLKTIGNMKVIFYEGETDDSGMIDGIRLPSPRVTLSDETIPNSTEYEIQAVGSVQKVMRNFIVSIYPGITVLQYINVIPEVDDIVR